MGEYIDILESWLSANQSVALVRVIKTWGSSPRPVGSIMLVSEEGKMAGSVSGGCVEGTVVKEVNKVLTDKKSKVVSFGVSDEEAWSVGLSCGGSLQLYIQTIEVTTSSVWNDLIENTKANKSSILISAIEDGRDMNALIHENGASVGDNVYDELINEAKNAYIQRSNKIVEIGNEKFFIQPFPRKPQLLIIGAAHITVDLVVLANQFSFETIVIDPRGYFTKNIVFPDPPTKVLQAYPSEVLLDYALDAYTFAAVLSHDPKIDDNALEILLPSDIAYIGALGSRKTHAKRISRLQEKGFTDELINRIKAPIGLPIHARSAREIALAIMAQIIEVKNEHILK